MQKPWSIATRWHHFSAAIQNFIIYQHTDKMPGARVVVEGACFRAFTHQYHQNNTLKAQRPLAQTSSSSSLGCHGLRCSCAQTNFHVWIIMEVIRKLSVMSTTFQFCLLHFFSTKIFCFDFFHCFVCQSSYKNKTFGGSSEFFVC